MGGRSRALTRELQRSLAEIKNAPEDTSIPRLKSMAASIAARLTYSVMKSLIYHVKSVTYWFDSATELAWLERLCIT